MNEREQLRPVYLDVDGDILTVNSLWLADASTYGFVMQGTSAALSQVYPDKQRTEISTDVWEIILREDGQTCVDLEALRSWMRDIRVDWQDAGAMPAAAPDMAAPSVAVFGSAGDIRNAAQAKAADAQLAELADRQAQGITSPTEQGDDEEVVVHVDDEEDDWEGSEPTMIPRSRPNPDAESNDDWDGTEVTALPQTRPQADDDWDGTEVTALPQSKQQADWDGAENTLVGAATDDWDGSEGTIVGQSAADWDGSEGTVVGQSAADWDGSEGTIVGAPDGARGSDKESSRTRTRTGTGTGTNPSFNDGWYLMGDPGPCTGQTWGDFEVGGILGAGGMGTVYRGRQFSLRRRVAIKVLPPHLQSDAQMRERFELEAQSASVLNSPNVVQVFTAGVEAGNAFYVMEFVEGCDLQDVVREYQAKEEMLDPHVAADYVIQAGRGLVEAQKHDFVHRDIKPPNLMLTKKGTVKIADFGIVKVLGESSMTMTGSAIGTPSYSAPEQGNGTGCDGRSDIYALGVVFYELLTLKKPFDGTTGNALIYQHTYTEPPMLTDVNPDCPTSYQTVVLKCMQKNPDDRYQTAQELVDDLERVRLGTAPLAQVFGTGADAMMKAQGLSRSSWKRFLIPAAAILLCAVGYFVYADYAQQRNENQQKIARLRASLQHLNNPSAPHASDSSNLAALQLLVVDDDTMRWKNKLTDISAMETSLRQLDASDQPSARVLTETRVSYDAYVAYVSADGQAAQRWNRKLNDATQKISTLRSDIHTQLQVTDQALNVVIWESVLPNVAILEKMAGETDSDVLRWNGRHQKFASIVAGLRTDLAPLDDETTVLTEHTLATMTENLNTLSPKIDSRDADVLRWRSTLSKRSGGLTYLREKLAVFDSPSSTPFASALLIADMGKDLETYRPLVADDDLSMQRWDKKIDDSQKIMKKNSEWLNINLESDDDILSYVVQTKARERLNIILPLFSDDDVNIETWTRRLSESERRTGNMQDLLTDVLNKPAISTGDIERARTSISVLDKLGALEAGNTVYVSKLREHEAHHAALRERLQAYYRVAPITAAMQADLTEFRRWIGTTDTEGIQWSEKNAHYELYRSKLLPLDGARDIPEGARDTLNELIALVNINDPDVIRWTEKLNAVDDLEKHLSPLERVEALPAQANDHLDTLADYIGERSPRMKARRIKVQRVAVLKDALAVIEEAYVLPLGADQQMIELLSLIGEADQETAQWIPIIKRLIGPARPAWASDFGRDAYGLYAAITVKGYAYRFRYVPSGVFNIGSPENETGRGDDEDQVSMTLTKGFWIAEQECVQSLWASLMLDNAHPSKFKGGDHPVERISWDDVQTFMERFNVSSELAQHQARLPYEVEWEYACRVGNEAARYTDDLGHGTELNMVAWHAGNSDKQTWPAAKRVNNALGLFDMHGNVWEWCADNYGGYPPAGAVNYTGGARSERVARGGSFYDFAPACRAANRLGINGNTRTMFIGFRIVIDLDNTIQTAEASASTGNTSATADIEELMRNAATLEETNPEQEEPKTPEAPEHETLETIITREQEAYGSDDTYIP